MIACDVSPVAMFFFLKKYRIGHVKMGSTSLDQQNIYVLFQVSGNEIGDNETHEEARSSRPGGPDCTHADQSHLPP